MQDAHPAEGLTDGREGISLVKRHLNALHISMALQGYSEIFVDRLGYNIIAVVRHCPATHRSIVLVSRLARSFFGIFRSNS